MKGILVFVLGLALLGCALPADESEIIGFSNINYQDAAHAAYFVPGLKGDKSNIILPLAENFKDRLIGMMYQHQKDVFYTNNNKGFGHTYWPEVSYRINQQNEAEFVAVYHKRFASNGAAYNSNTTVKLTLKLGSPINGMYKAAGLYINDIKLRPPTVLGYNNIAYVAFNADTFSKDLYNLK